MKIKEVIKTYNPKCEQEQVDKAVMLKYLDSFADVLTRANTIGHFTSSGFITNKTRDKVLFVHHNIYKMWGWTGGHMDGDTDFLYVALKEAREETGVQKITPLKTEIASLDILPVQPHLKNGEYIATHMHLSVAFILEADELETLQIRPEENSGVRWFTLAELEKLEFDPCMVPIYNKLLGQL
jgi:NTP pyrophosphohydrolases including oxidative damage repair enzymes